MFSSFPTLIKALTNIFIFLPYYFSVDAMIGSLFSPWKRIVSKKESKGFSFSDFGNELSMELVSRGIGFFVRLATIATYLFVQLVFLPTAIIIVIFYGVLIFPLQFAIKTFSTTDKEKYEAEKQRFVDSHLLDIANREIVEGWFDAWYRNREHLKMWWELDNLFNTVPIGRDWTHGFTPTLDKYAIDMSAHADQFESRPMTLGREKEMQEIENVLCKNQGANILLIGEEGVGKLTVIESLAYRIHIGRGNPLLSFKRLLKINFERVLSENTDPKIRENILESLFDGADKAGSIIFVFENIDRYLSSGEGRVDLSIPLEKFTRSNRIHVVGLSTPYAYQKYLYPKDFLRSSFTLIELKEVTKELALVILLDHCHRFEMRYDVIIPYETLVASIDKSAFFISEIPFPEKALQILDDACVYTSNNPNIPKNSEHVVAPEIIDVVLSKRTHTPTTLNKSFKEKLLTINDKLGSGVIGQQKAIKNLSDALQRSFLLLGKRTKPLASFLFLGPTGVGKTETAKILAKEFFDTEHRIIRFDMSEFQRVEDIPHLIGDVTSGEPGQLISRIREQPYGVLLLDEIEKAHKNLLNIFLSLLDEGYISDANGKKVDCKSLVVIATSNAGAIEFYSNLTNKNAEAGVQGDIMDFLITNRYFSPEFLNRFDGVIAFEPLTGLNAYAIAKKMIDRVASDIAQNHGVTVNVKDETIQSILKEKFNPAYGARNLERAIQQVIETTIAQKVLTGEAKAGSTVEV
ncbi:MAG: AAA family ATPase [Patescibacteria group bacterium]